MYFGGDRGPKFLGQYLHKIRVFSAVYPNFSFRQLPSASVGFRGIQSPNLMPNSEETGSLRDSSGTPYNYLATRRAAPPTPHTAIYVRGYVASAPGRFLMLYDTI